MTEFWAAFWGAVGGAGLAFVLSHVRNHFEENRRQKTALRDAQLVLADHVRVLRNYRDDFLRLAKDSRDSAALWFLLVPMSTGSTPRTLKLEALTFLLDEKFNKLAPGHPNTYVEVQEASNRFEASKKLIEHYDRTKAELQAYGRTTAPSVEVLFESNVQETEFSRDADALLMQARSLIMSLDSKIDSDLSALEDAFCLLDSLFRARWRKSTGIKLLPDARNIDPRQRYEDIHR